MATVRVTKIFRFEMAHALWGYDGLCKNIHGHSYVLKITVSGTPIENPADKKLGMVIDFGDLKRVVNKYIVDVFDHSLVLSKNAPTDKFDDIREMFDRRTWFDFQPTAENMVVYFAGILQAQLPSTVKLQSVRLYETVNSYAEWLAEDQ
ncbi:MAG: 6-carboxytetrahydropterin synthase [Bacteroidales bacterium]|jgi:6-pyruvoyltetrahydropterin/6-carboxytetrahydropterin synthase|nr:6-carboxytetrahydropterin synthase [Bacteroidales bacterium]